MSALPFIPIKLSETLKKSLSKTTDTITDLIEDVAVIVWLYDESHNLAAKMQSNAGSTVIDQFKLNLEDDDFVVTCFKTGSKQERENLHKAPDFMAIEYAEARRWGSALAYPLQTPDEARYGVLGIYTIGYQGFKKRVQRQIEAAVDLISVTIEGQLRAEQIKGLLDLPGKITNGTSIQQTLSDVAEVIQDLLRADYVDIYCWNAQTKSFEVDLSVIYPPESYEHPPVPQQAGATYQTLASPTPLLFSKANKPGSFTSLENELGIEMFWGVRLVIDEDIDGVLHINYKYRRQFDDDFEDILLKAASSIASVICEARLFEQVRYQATAFEKLSAVSQSLSSFAETKQDKELALLYQIVASAQVVLHADTATIYEYLQSENRFVNTVQTGEHLIETDPKRILAGPSLFTFIDYDKSEYILDAQAHSVLTEKRQVSIDGYPEERYAIREKIKSTAIVPLTVEQQKAGLMFINYRTSQLFPQVQKNIIEAFANQAAIAIFNTRSYTNIVRRVEGLNALNEVGQRLTALIEFSETEIIEQFYEEVKESLNCEDMYIALYNDETQEVRFPLYNVQGKPYPLRNRFLDATKKGKTEEIILKQQSILHRSLEEAKTWYSERDREHLLERSPWPSYIGVPMIFRGKSVGVIAIYDTERENVFDELDKEILETMANQVAIALENARLYYDVNRKLEHRVEGLNALNKVGDELTSRIRASESEILELIYDQAQRLTQCKDMYIALYDNTTREIRFGLYLERGERKPLSPRLLNEQKQGKTEAIILTKEPILHKTKQESESWYGQPDRQEYTNFIQASWLGVPMMVGNEVIGVIAIYDVDREYVYDETDRETFQAMASQAAIALENARLYYDVNRKLEHRVEGLNALNKVGDELTSRIRASESEILELIYDQAQRLTQCEDMYIALYDNTTREIRFGLYLERGERKPLSPRLLNEQKQGKTEAIILTKEPILHKTKQESESWYGQPDRQEFAGRASPSWLGVPMMVGNEVIGVIAIYDVDREYVYDETDRETFQAMASQAAIALENARLYYDVNQKLERRVQALGIIKEFGDELALQIQATEETIRELTHNYAHKLVQQSGFYFALYNDQTKAIHPNFCQLVGNEHHSRPKPIRRLNETQLDRTEWVILNRKPLHHRTKQELEKWYQQSNRHDFNLEAIGCTFMVPLITEDKVVGVMAVYDTERENLYDEMDVEFLSTLANEAAVALNNVRLYHEIEQRLYHKEIVQAIANAVRTQPDLPQALQVILDETNQYLGADAISIQTLDDIAQELTVQASIKAVQTEWRKQLHVSQAKSKTINIGAEKGSQYYYYINTLNNTLFERIIPIQDRDETLLGIFLVEQATPDYTFDENKQELAQLIADQTAAIIQQAKIVEEGKRNSEFAALGAAIAAIQHRINNTISIIPPNVTFLKNQLNLDDPDIVEAVEIIERNVSNASEYIRKIQKFLQDLGPSKANIVSLVKDAHQRIKEKFDDLGDSDKIHVDFDTPEETYVAKVPLTQTIEVFSNVIENGYKAVIKQGQGKLKINIVRVDSEIVITITNTGPCIPDDVLEHLLKKPVPPKDQEEGTGLGLWLSSILLRKYGGDITIANKEVGDGVVVIIRLPTNVGGGEYRMNRPAILIIDNDQSWINNLREHLGRTYNIDVAQNSIEAMEKLSQDNYELLIVSSLEIAALENIHSLYPTKRLVVVTNKPTTQEAIKMYDYGAMDYLAKEFDQDISSKMEQVIKIPVIAS